MARKNHRWTYADIQRLEAKHPVLTMPELMAHFKMTKHQIDNAIRRYGLRENRKHIYLTDEERDVIMKLSSRMTPGQIAIRTGMKLTNVKYWVKQSKQCVS